MMTMMFKSKSQWIHPCLVSEKKHPAYPKFKKNTFNELVSFELLAGACFFGWFRICSATAAFWSSMVFQFRWYYETRLNYRNFQEQMWGRPCQTWFNCTPSKPSTWTQTKVMMSICPDGTCVSGRKPTLIAETTFARAKWAHSEKKTANQ